MILAPRRVRSPQPTVSAKIRATVARAPWCAVVPQQVAFNYLRPAKDRERLVAVAAVVGSGATQAVCRCDVYVVRGVERTLCAAAQGTVRKAA